MRNRLILIIAAMALLIVAIPVAASADGHVQKVTKEMVDGGWSCPDGSKVDTGEPGTYEVYYGPNTKGTITITKAAKKQVMFKTDAPNHYVDSVLVKGGKNALLYMFEPAVTEGVVHAPMNMKNGKYYGVSHLCFMTHKKSVS